MAKGGDAISRDAQPAFVKPGRKHRSKTNLPQPTDAPAISPIPAIATGDPDAAEASPRRTQPRIPPQPWWKWWVERPVPEVQAPFKLSHVGADYANRLQLFNAIAEQIWREQQLVSTRMRWNFTFQGFLAGIYVFASSNLDDLPRFLIQLVLSSVGFAVTVLSLFGVRAAQRQSTRLKEHWLVEFHPDPPHDPGDCNIQGGAFPQPFSSSSGSISGRSSSIGVCYALMVMWVAMLGITCWMKAHPPVSAASDYSCQLKPAPNASGELTITCKNRGSPVDSAPTSGTTSPTSAATPAVPRKPPPTKPVTSSPAGAGAH